MDYNPNLFNMSTDECNTFTFLIDDYVQGESFDRRNDLEEILSPWHDAKSEFLYGLMGEQLMCSKEVSYERSIDELCEDFWEKHYDDPAYLTFKNDYNAVINTNPALHEHRIILNRLIDPYHFISNKVNFDILNYFNGDEYTEYTELTIQLSSPYTIRNGAKTMRVLQKIADFYHITSFENFRLFQSRLTNTRTLKGELTLSIHPLDYATMSDNDCGWTSCMSWMEDGEYRMGTVEMMNSPYVIVAYLGTSRPFRITNSCYWSNKKWRELFVVTPDLIAGIKGYPYQQSNLESIVINWIAELAEANLNWKYDGQMRNYVNTKVAQTDVSIVFSTRRMYNDFGTRDAGHPIMLRDGLPLDSFLSVHYSGLTECLWCGATNIYCDTDTLSCDNCYHIDYCCVCGDVTDTNDYYKINGQLYCPYCYRDHAHIDIFTGEIDDYDNMNTLRIVETEEDGHKHVINTIHYHGVDTEIFKPRMPLIFKTDNPTVYFADYNNVGLRFNPDRVVPVDKLNCIWFGGSNDVAYVDENDMTEYALDFDSDDVEP